MKHILTTLLLFICLQGVGQNPKLTTDLLYQPFPSLGGYGLYIGERAEVVSKYDTTILNIGDEKCLHIFATQKPNYSNLGQSCGVFHGAAGCPNNWLNEKRICTKCLRHIQIKEGRTVNELPPPKDEYQEALDKLNKKMQPDTKGNIIKQ